MNKVYGFAAASVALLALGGAALPAQPEDGWEGARTIDAGDDDALLPDVACDGSGNAIAVFYQDVGAEHHVFANRYEAEAGWQGAVRLDTADDRDSTGPVVAFDARGNAMATYVQMDASSHWRVRVNRYSPETGWGGPEGPIDGGSRDAGEGRPAFGPDGSAVVLFSQKDALGTYRIYASRYREGWGWTGPGDPLDAGEGPAQAPQIAFAPDGSALALFQHGSGTRRIYSARWEDGAWSAPGIIDAGTGEASGPRLAFGADGSAVAVFVQGGPLDQRVYANRWAGGEWTGPTAVSGGAGALKAASVAVDGAGNATVVYAKNDESGSHYRVYANRHEPSGGWTGSELIDAGDQEASAPRIAAGGDGAAIAVFSQSDGGAHRVYANRCEGGAWAGATAVDAGGVGSYTSPDIAFGGDGNALCVFDGWDGAVHSVLANRYVSPQLLIDLTPDKREFSPTDRIAVKADVRPIAEKAYPFVRVVMPGGDTLYYERGRGFSDSPVPYLGFAAGPVTVPSALRGYDVMSVSFSGIRAGTYSLEGGAVDAVATTSADDLVYLGTVDRETLAVR